MRVDSQVSDRRQKLVASKILLALADSAYKDASLAPAINAMAMRWHVRVRKTEFEPLLTGPKFWDVRTNSGGSAVCMVMHLNGCHLKPAVALVKPSGL